MKNSVFPAVMEGLESRLLLSSVEFATPLADSYLVDPSAGALTIGVDGYDDDGDALTITAITSSPYVHATVYGGTTNTYATLHFVDGDGVAIGDIVVQLFDSRAADAVERFVTLSTEHINSDGTIGTGDPFYTDVLVHRVIDDFMIQTGDAVNANGTGSSPLPNLADDFDPDLSFTGTGVLAFANSGVNTSNCQFFITEVSTQWLNGGYYIFGQVISGMDVLNTISEVDTNSSDKPLEDIFLQSVDIHQSPQDATITFIVDEGFTGTADVTVTLDDGSGGTASQTITLVSVPEIANIPDAVIVTEGQTVTFTPDITAFGGNMMDLSIQRASSSANATLLIDDDTHEISITGASNFSGLFAVTIYAKELGHANDPTSSYTFYVITTGQDEPQGVGRAPTETPGSSMSCDKLGDTLYVASSETGLEIFDISDPAAPQLLGSYDGGSVWEVQVAQQQVNGQLKTVAYLVDIGESETTWRGVTVLDVTNPSAVTLLDSYEMSDAGSLEYPVSATLDGNYLYVPAYGAGLAIFDVSNPADIVQIAYVQDFGASGSIVSGISLAIKGNYAYLADAYGGQIVILNISDPSTPQWEGSFYADIRPWDVSIQGNLLYTIAQYADTASTLRVFDISDPTAPSQINSLNVSGKAWQKINANSNVVIYSTSAGFTVLDATNPQVISTVQNFQGPTQGGQAYFYDDMAVLPFGGYGTVITDISKPLIPYAYEQNISVEINHSIDITLTTSHTTSYDEITFTITDQPDHGTLVEISHGVYRYTPNSDYSGSDSFAFTASDQYGETLQTSQAATVDINVFDLSIPTASNQNVSTNIREPIEITLVANDLETSYENLTFAITAAPTHGTLQEVSHGVYRYTPNGLYIGTDSFQFTATDTSGKTSPNATVSLQVKGKTVGLDEKGTATYTDASGDEVTVKLKGAGNGTLYFAGTENSDLDTLVLTGTDEKSSLTISTKGTTTVALIDVDGSLKSITGKTTNLDGEISISGTVAAITLGDVLGGSSIVLNSDALAAAKDVKLTFANVTDTGLTSNNMGIKSVTVTQWIDQDGEDNDTITAPYIGKITTKVGNFNADLELTAADSKGYSLKSAKIKGIVACEWNFAGSAGSISAAGFASSWEFSADGDIKKISSTANMFGTIEADYIAGITAKGNMQADITAYMIKNITVSGNVEHTSINIQAGPADGTALTKLSAKGWIAKSSVISNGHIKSVSAGGIENSVIYAGIERNNLTALSGDLPYAPVDADVDILTAAATKAVISKISITGKVANNGYSFINSNIAAGELGTLKLANVKTSNDSEIFIIAADYLKKLTFKNTPVAESLAALDAALTRTFDDLKIDII